MTSTLEKWIRDFAHAARSLARAPGFTLIVIATLALAIGASTAIFSLVKVVLLERLPYPERRSARPRRRDGPGNRSARGVRRAGRTVLRVPRERSAASRTSALYGTGSSTTRAEGRVDQLFVTQATPSFFTTLGAQPLHGRLPDRQGRRHASSSSATGCGRDWFNSDQAVIGRSYSFAGQNRDGDRHHEAGIPLPR